MDGDIALIKELLESQISNIHEKIETSNKNLVDKIDSSNRNVMTELSYIKEQTTRTNGRVNKHDDQIQKLFQNNAERHATCPGLEDVRSEIKEMDKKVNKIDEDNFFYKIVNRYPKTAILVITINVIMMLASIATAGYAMIRFRNTLSSFQKVEKTIQQDETSNKVH